MIGAEPQSRAGPQEAFHSRLSSEFYAYWRSLLRPGVDVPLRADFDPAAITSLLPYIFIVEKQADSGRYYFRLSGTRIRDIMGFENTGRFLDELLSGADLVAVTTMFDEVISQGVCIRSIEGLTYSDRSYQRAEIVRLPLRRTEDDRTLVIGCLSRIENDGHSGTAGSSVENKQVIRIDNDVLPRAAF